MNARLTRWFRGLADDAEHFIRARIERLAAAARPQADQLIERVGARLAGVAVAIAVMIIAVWLLAVGLAGAISAALGQEWLGQLLAGGFLLLATWAGLAISRARAQRRREREASRAAQLEALEAERERDAQDAAKKAMADALSEELMDAGTDALRQHPIAGMAALGAAGVLAGSILSARSNGHSRRH